ncbi:MAG: radical SAM protein [bacterium]
MLHFLADLENLQPAKLSSDELAVLEFLAARGVVNGRTVYAPRYEPRGELDPDKLTLFPSNNCNLNCQYCYAADAHVSAQTMDWKIAVSAVDYFIDYLRKHDRQLFQLELHGGGEPFYAWSLVQGIVGYAEERCQQEGLTLEVYAASNGMLNDNQLCWITEHLQSLNVSFDGLPQVQNFHRQTVQNNGSFERVDQTLKFFDEHRFRYAIRCTVSSFNENLLEETVEFILQNYRTNLLILEPVYVCGSCLPVVQNLKPDLYKFVEGFKILEPLCAQKGVLLEYSGASFEKIAPVFCYVGSDNFAVTPDGYLTNCWEVTSKQHPLSEHFIFGRVLADGRLEVDREKLNHLRSLSVHNLEYCRDCFARWHCAGDCVTRLGHHQFDGARGGERCETNRQIIAHRIRQMFERDNFLQGI